MAEEQVFEVPYRFRRGGKKGSHRKLLESSHWLLDYMAGITGREDLSDVDMLDMGCGSKFTQAMLTDNIPIHRYVGIDVYGEMIEFLDKQVQDPRFEYKHFNIHNEMYNPGGTPLADYTDLGVEPASFDIICLFSVFTHLAPHDFPAMLRLLRPYIRPEGRLIFSLFINEYTENGAGLITRFQFPNSVPSEQERKDYSPPEFLDLDKNKPLKFAVYSREYATELVSDTGWSIESLRLPVDGQVQHHFVCAPIP